MMGGIQNTMNDYIKGFERISINDMFQLEKANFEDFRVRYTIYKKFNPYFRYSWDEHINVVSSSSNCFWILYNHYRVGGVLIASNSVSGLFLIPPFIDINLVIEALSKHLLSKYSEVDAYSIPPFQLNPFLEMGYKVTNQQVCMIRPTEVVHTLFHSKYVFNRIDNADIPSIYPLIQEDYYDTQNLSLSQLQNRVNNEIDWYFKNQFDKSACNKASTIVLDKKTDEVIGVCLVSMWEGSPLIYHIATKKSYQKQGIATSLINYTLSVLKNEYTYVRLFVTIGNPAQKLYHKLGFAEGDIVTDLKIRNKEGNHERTSN